MYDCNQLGLTLYLADYNVMYWICIYRWGCTHEETALQRYKESFSKEHSNFKVTSAGLFLDDQYTFIGATPDGITDCTCCGKGLVEVKCPHCVKDGLPEEDTRNFCMVKIDGQWSLKTDHAYFYQVQTQLRVCKAKHCDFVVWTEKDIVAERIVVNQRFFEDLLERIEHFFVCGVLPEVIGKWYTRKPITDTSGIVQEPAISSREKSPDLEDYERSWCYCNQPSYGTTIGCDNSECTIQWFHCECLRIRCPPKGKCMVLSFMQEVTTTEEDQEELI